jgi:hypothetical protein
VVVLLWSDWMNKKLIEEEVKDFLSASDEEIN